MVDTIYHLFVYGSLRSGFQSPAYDYISQYFDLVGDARVKGRWFDMGDYPAAVPAAEDLFIVGELYRIKKEPEFPWAIGQLDDYEGIVAEAGEIPLYKRDLAEVFCNSRNYTAWIYWYTGNVEGKERIVSGDILDYLK